MMLAPTLAGTPPRPALRRRWRFAHILLDLVVLAVGVGLCGFLLFDGGLEALIGAGLGAVLSARNATTHTARNAVSGALGGLFAGAMFAGFFHNAIEALVFAL
jgi:hypothetical protein